MLPPVRLRLWHIALALGWTAFSPASAAATLTVGPGGAFAQLAAAAAAARAGDRIAIAPGTFYQCASFTADGLTIEGAGPDRTVLTDATCAGKAILVIGGKGDSVRGLTLARARAADGNGAGIRAEGGDLAIDNVVFRDDQDGVLAADAPEAALRITGCAFDGDGAGGAHPTAALEVGDWRRLDVQATRFTASGGGASIRSAAAFTKIADSEIGAASLGASVQASGGLAITGSALEAGGGPGGHRAAVLSLPGGVEPMLLLRSDRLRGSGTLLLNWSGRAPDLRGNIVPAGATEASAAGAWRYRLSALLHQAYRAAHAAAGSAKRRLLAFLHG